MAMLEIVVSGIRCGLLQISQNRFGTLDSKVSQEAAATFPKFEISYLDQILEQDPRRLPPERGRAHNSEADRLSDTGNELLPCLVITRPGTQADDVFQRQRRITRHFRKVGHLLFLNQMPA